MKKKTSLWTISELMDRVNRIEFPEYQREPTIWTRAAKQRLVDSIVRDFDISAIYLYSDRKDSWDCVDGRQRISAIQSFFNENLDDREDNGFDYRLMNEIFDDDDHPYESLDGHNYEEIEALADDMDEVAKSFVQTLLEYPLTVVVLSDSARPEEFNLQFTRLNLGQLIISGEKLHAMVGDLRNVCFGDFGQHAFLRGIDIPTRRYAQQQLAAQIVSQVFELEESRRDGTERRFARMRHVDLQRLFKVHMTLGGEQKAWIERVLDAMNLLAGKLDVLPSLRSRSIVLSLVLLAYEYGIEDEEDASDLAEFASCFVGRLRWQVGLGLDVDDEYRYLIDFQRYLTQASGERYSVRERARELERSFNYWLEHNRLIGDAEYEENQRKEPESR